MIRMLIIRFQMILCGKAFVFANKMYIYRVGVHFPFKFNILEPLTLGTNK
jgi:hypothetical protein